LACVRWSKVCWVITVPMVRPCARARSLSAKANVPRLCETSLCLSKRGLEGPAINREQKIARLHHLAVRKWIDSR